MLKKLHDSFFSWWQGELQIPEIEELFSGDEKSFENKEQPEEYKYHWSSKITRTLWFFWQKHWGILSLIIVGILTIATMLFTHFDNNPINNQVKIEQSKN